MLAIPDTCIFTICSMINVVILQFLIELLIIIRNKLLHHYKKRRLLDLMSWENEKG